MLPLMTGDVLVSSINAMLSSIYSTGVKLDMRSKLNTVCSNGCYLYETHVADVYLKVSDIDPELLTGLIVGKVRSVFRCTAPDPGVGVIEPVAQNRFYRSVSAFASDIPYLIVSDMDFQKLVKRANAGRYYSNSTVSDMAGFYIPSTEGAWTALMAEEGVVTKGRIGSNVLEGVELTGLSVAAGGGTIVRDIGGF